MAVARTSRSSRRLPGQTYGMLTPIKCCYPYTPASPASMQPSHQPNPQPQGTMAQAHKPLFQNPTPVTRCLPENPTSDLALALPSLEHLTQALYAHASQQDCATVTRRRDKHGRDRRVPSRDRRERRTASCERRASMVLPYPSREATHVSIEAVQPVQEPQPARTFETSSPRRKMHYVPATPSIYSPQVNTFELKQSSPRASLPTPPSSLPSSSPKQQYHSPDSVPKLLLAPPSPPPTRNVAEADAALSKFRRLVLACRETKEDEDRIDALIDSYDQIMGSLVDEVIMDSVSDSN